MIRSNCEEMVNKIDYAARHDLMGTADLCEPTSRNPQVLVHPPAPTADEPSRRTGDCHPTAIRRAIRHPAAQRRLVRRLHCRVREEESVGGGGSQEPRLGREQGPGEGR
jgi:hypothetical protein